MIYPYLTSILSTLLLAGTHFFNPVKASHYQRNLISPPLALKHLHFGYNEVIADSLWLRALQDFDYCETKISKNICKGNGWLYHMLDTMLALSPHFRVPAVTGGVALSVLISDIEGASKFFDTAVKFFPNDWQILYYAAYHAIYEEKNKEKAAGYLIRAARNGGKEWFYNLAVRLYTEAGQRELGLSVYQNLKDSNFDSSLLRRMEEKLGFSKNQDQ